MAFNGNAATFNKLQSLLYSSITSSYVAIGVPLPLPAVVVGFINTTNADILISIDGTNDYLIIPQVVPGQVFDIRTNAPQTSDFMFPEGTQFYAKTAGSPSSGSIYMQAVLVQQIPFKQGSL